MDDKAVDSNLTISVLGTVVAAGTNVADDDWSKLTSEVGLEHSFTDDVMVYAKFSTGYKAGGFNATSLQGSSYDPEEVNALEAGIKSRMLDERLQLNLATFYYDYKDKQEYQIEQVASVLTNASAATVFGAELELQAALGAALRLEGSVTALRAEYDAFDTVDPNNPQLGLQNLSGNQLTRTPELKASIGARYTLNTGFGPITAYVSYSWQDELFYRPYNTDLDRVGSQGRSNARITWSSLDAAWTVDAYINNIDDGDDISNQVVASPGLGGIVTAEYLPPRTYGLKVSYEFAR
jgi:iron complex outermembrane receptor protein